MRLSFIKLLSVFLFLVLLFSLSTMKVFAIPIITGHVVLTGTGAGLPNIWVKWMEDYGTPYQSAYRYAQTDATGTYSFDDLSTEPPGQEKKLATTQIDTNSDGVLDDVELFVDPTKPIPNAPLGADEFFHFNAANSPHAFIAILPNSLVGLGTFNTVDNIIINDADTSMTLPDIVYTPSASSISAAPTPVPTYSITGNVFNDNNNNGNKDLLESGYAGATVNITGPANSTVTTDMSGNYSFVNLPAGSYTVAIVVPVGYNVTTASSSNIDLTKSQTVNFGMSKAIIGAGCTASITGSVINDLNWNGNLDPGETPISNWTVNLNAFGLAAPLTTTTNSSGTYTFTGLCTNIFTVTQTVSTPWFTTKSQSIVMIVIDGFAYTNINFFDAEKFSVNGHAFLDPNGDGIITAGSKGYKGVVVILTGTTASGPLFRQVTTPADGSYSFTDLPVGTYKILFGQVAGYRSTMANALNFDLINNQTIDYGLTPVSTIKADGACNNSTLDIVLVLDHSGSMNHDDAATGIPKITEAIQAASGFVDIIMRNLPTARIGLVQFSDSDNFDVNDTGSSDPSSLLLPLTSDVTQIKTAINNLSANGHTCVQCGVQLANKALNDGTRPNSQKMIVFMTDGMANETADDPGSQDISTNDAENAAMNDLMNGIDKQNIIYDTIGLGSSTSSSDNSVGESDNIDELFLKAIASTNLGSYYNDPTNGNLQQIFTVIASNSVPTGGITGIAYNDKDLSTSYNSAIDGIIADMPINLTGANLPKPLSTTSDNNGNYGFYGLCDSNGKNYTVSEGSMPPWVLTTAGSNTISVAGGALYQNNNFGNRYGYQISGSVFNDINKNRLRDATDQNYTGSITISSKGTLTDGILTTNPDGTYEISGLYPGAYTVSYTSPIPPGFNLIWPINGPPPSLLANIGPGCSVDGTAGAFCDSNDNVSNLNFAISNSIPWIQFYDMDIRFDNGLTDTIPAAPKTSPFASVADSFSANPGIIFSGNGSTDFGQGQASTTGQTVGGISYPETYVSSNQSNIKTSYAYLLNKASSAGIKPTDLASVCNISNCTLPPNLPHGIYLSNGNLLLNQYTFSNNSNYIILVNGNLTMNNSISVDNGSTVLFSSSGDIIVSKNVQAAVDDVPLPVGQLQGFFSADRNFIIQGNNDCVLGQDKMLNVDGSIVINAGQLGGKLINQRDLCGDDPLMPSFTVRTRPDFILNAPTFLMDQTTIYNEEAP